MKTGNAGKKAVKIVLVGRGLLIFAAVILFFNSFLYCRADDAVFTPEEREFIQKQDVLKVGYVADRKPISFMEETSGELKGVSRMIFDHIMELSGLKFEYVALPSGSVTYDYLWKEHFDLITSVEYNEANKKSRGILISSPYLSSKKVIIGNPKLEFDTGKHLRIAVSTGSQTLKTVLKEQYPNFEIVDYDSIEDCFEAVKQGINADLLIQNQFVAEYWLNKPRYEGLEIIPMASLDDMLCFSAVVPLENTDAGTEKVLEEKREILSILDKSIAQITDDEIAAYLIDATLNYRYVDNFSDFMYRYRYRIIVIIISLLMVCVLAGISVFFYIRSMEAQAEAKAKAKGDFLSAMSHEMRTPLNGLTGLHYIMSQNLKDEERLTDALQQSAIMTRYLLSLVNDILEMSELRENRIVLDLYPFSLRVMLEALETMEQKRMEEKGITFRIEKNLISPGLIGDEKRVEQVFLQLLDNAWKYTPAGGFVTVTVTQEQAADGRIATKILVADTGCGMSREFQKKIFESFTQEQKTVSKGNQGTGLGMSISYVLAKLMDGDLQVESALGEGSRFTFLFLARPAEEPSTLIREQRPEKETAAGRKILVAEDNELNAEILMELLTEGGYEAVHVRNGQEAIDVFAASRPGEFSVILMDLMMPEKDGFEAARGIRKMNRADAGSVKIFACTANTLNEDKKKAYDSGMDDFISKPVDVNELFRKLNL